MSINNFPVANALLGGCEVADLRSMSRIPQAEGYLVRTLSRSVLFDIASAASIANDSSRKGGWDLSRDFGALRIPYPSTWMEWHASSAGAEKKYASFMAAKLTERRVDDDHIAILVELFNLDRHGAVKDQGFRSAIVTDNNGVFVNFGHEVKYPDLPVSEKLAGASDDHLWAVFQESMIPVFFAINLMNCKNIQVQDGVPIRVPRKLHKKTGQKKPLRQSTIVLPGMSGGSTGGSAGDEGVMARHRVRGHFKTFTDEKPLLGKHTGTYWWGWQVRGNAKNGTVISDYKVSA